MNKSLEAVNALKYATAENAPRYRPIMRFLFNQYDKFRDYIKSEEILAHMKSLNLVDNEYIEEQLYSDMKALEAWDCVMSRQDKEMVYTIEDFKKKRLKFQITPLAYEIESTLKKLDDLDEVLTGALESREFERILKDVENIAKSNVKIEKDEILHDQWITLMRRLENLRSNSANYISHLRSDQAETLFKTEEFLLYKEKFTNYLTKFIVSMKKTRYKIARVLMEIEDPFVEGYINRLIEYFSTIPMIDGKRLNAEKINRAFKDDWVELRHWFVRGADYECDVDALLQETDKSIQTISRYALQLIEVRNKSRNRKEDYRELSTMFGQCEDINKAHELAACCFGISTPRHIYASQKATDTKDEEIWEQEMTYLETTPKSRGYERRKRIKSYVRDKGDEKKAIRKIYLERMEKEKEMIRTIIIENRIVIKELGSKSSIEPMNPFVRQAILEWISKAVQNKANTGRTQYGRKFTLVKHSSESVLVRFEDGVLRMPNITFEFEGV